MTIYFHIAQDFHEQEIARLKYVISEVECYGEKAINEFDKNRGIDKQKALEILKNQLAYFKSEVAKRVVLQP